METKAINVSTDGLIFELIPIGFKNNVAYLLADAQTRDAAIVDVGFKPDLILEHVRQRGLRLNYIIATHGHLDHIGAAGAIREATGAQLAAYKTVPDVDVVLDDGDRLLGGTIPIDVLHTPGHTPDCICLLIAGQQLLTGDTMYVGKVPGASHCNKRDAEGFYESIRRLMDLDESVEVWPGHDRGTSLSSTIDRERRENSCVSMNFREFWKRKKSDKASGKWIAKSSKQHLIVRQQEGHPRVSAADFNALGSSHRTGGVFSAALRRTACGHLPSPRLTCD